MGAVLIWWLSLQVIGLVALPIALTVLRFLPDRGYGMARPMGLLVSGYVFWLLVSLSVLRNTAGNIVAVLVMLALLSAWLWTRHGREMMADLRKNRRLVLTTELVFAVSFLLFALFRAYNPDIAATEKPMEFAFINGILRSRSFPPKDPWLAGYSISYYYFGYVLSAMLTRLTGVVSDIGFGLTGATLFALTVSGAFSLGANLVVASQDPAEGDGTRHSGAVLTGVLSSLLVAVTGNLEGIFEILRAHGLGSERLFAWLDIKNLRVTEVSKHWYPDDLWWWWRASRVIHDRDLLGNSVEVIDEFPFFSFLLGDNHPHVLALPFVFLALALALNLLLWRGERNPACLDDKEAKDLDPPSLGLLERLLPGAGVEPLIWALLLGSLGFLNTWDLPIYWGILCLAYGARHLRDTPFGLRWFVDICLFGGAMLVTAIVAYLPFYLSFRSQAGGVGLVGPVKTRLHQYLIMLGIPLFGVLSLLVVLVARWARTRQQPLPFLAQAALGLSGVVAVFCLVQGWWTLLVAMVLSGLALALLVDGSVAFGGLAGRVRTSGAPDLLALIAAATGLLLTAFCEVAFLRDTFGTRMNTVFKFYYQAWVLLAVAGAYGVYFVVRQLSARRAIIARAGLGLWGVVGVALLCSGLSYTVAATASRANGFAGQPSLDGTRYIKEWRPDDYAAVQWLRQNAEMDAVMAEAPGGSYSEYNWVSAHTGIPTLLGWGGHELQWRGNYDIPAQREPDLQTLYASGDVEATRVVLDRYGVDYVYVGRLERAKYGVNPTVLAKLDRLMVRAYEHGSVIIYAFQP